MTKSKTVTVFYWHYRCGGNMIPLNATKGHYVIDNDTGRIIFKDESGQAIFECDRCEHKGEITEVPK